MKHVIFPFTVHLSIFLLCCISQPLVAQEQSSKIEKYSRVKIHLTKSNTLEKLHDLGLEVDHGEMVDSKTFISELSSSELALLQGVCDYEVLIDDLTKYYQARTALDMRTGGTPTPDGITAFGCTYTTPTNFNGGTLAGYLTLNEMLAELDEMRTLYPNLISVKQPMSSTLTHEGRQIFYVRISDNPDVDEPETEVFYNAMHHAREPMSMMSLIYYMHWLLENYSSNTEVQDLVNNNELYFAPCLNPDGYEYNRTTNPNGGGMWRKNRRNNGNGTFGVDLNRNYGYQWGVGTGSSSSTSSDTYRGPSAFSEPETQMVRDFCNAHQFVTTLNEHSYSNLLIHPWEYVNSCPDLQTFTNIADDLNTCNNYIYGTTFGMLGYYASGTATDWMYGEQTTKPLIYAITPEIGSSTDGFWPVPSQIIPLCQIMMYTNLRNAQLAANLECKVTNIQVVPSASTATVSWTGATQSSNFNVRYRTVGSSTWTVVPSTTNSVVLTGLTICSNYEVQVQSVCSAVSGYFSPSTLFSTISDPLPSGWVSGDVGTTSVARSSCYNGTSLTHALTGAGSLTTSTSDAFRFVYTTLVGDGSITARVASLTSTNNHKAGVMIRESLANNARHASTLVLRSSSAWRTQYLRRTSAGGTASSTQPTTTTTPPYWVRISRSGNTFTSASSANGTTWTNISSGTITMPTTTPILIGIVAASGSTTATSTASITNVTKTGNSAANSDDRSALTEHQLGFSLEALYPNPGTDYLNLRFHLDRVQPVKFRIVDMLGKSWFVSNEQTYGAGISEQNFLVGKTLPAGFYLVQCLVNDQIVNSQRWVKQ